MSACNLASLASFASLQACLQAFSNLQGTGLPCKLMQASCKELALSKSLNSLYYLHFLANLQNLQRFRFSVFWALRQTCKNLQHTLSCKFERIDSCKDIEFPQVPFSVCGYLQAAG